MVGIEPITKSTAILKPWINLVGVSWLQIVLNGKLVTLVPIVKEKEYLECVVAMPQKEGHQVRETDYVRIIDYLYYAHTLFLQTGLVRDWRGTSQIRPSYGTRTLDKAKGQTRSSIPEVFSKRAKVGGT